MEEKTEEQAMGLRLKGARVERGWTQEQIAKELGLSTDQVGRIERGEVEPSLSLGARWARKCAVRLGRILGEVNRG
jgi:transcriptional regulator with XRE-family HTH domain